MMPVPSTQKAASPTPTVLSPTDIWEKPKNMSRPRQSQYYRTTTFQLMNRQRDGLLTYMGSTQLIEAHEKLFGAKDFTN